MIKQMKRAKSFSWTQSTWVIFFFDQPTEYVDGVTGMDFRERDRQSMVDQTPKNMFNSNISRQSKSSTTPTSFSRDRCLLLIRFLIFLATGATMFQLAMFVRYYHSQTSPLIVLAILSFSALFLIGALIDLRRILKLRSEAKRM